MGRVLAWGLSTFRWVAKVVRSCYKCLVFGSLLIIIIFFYSVLKQTTSSYATLIKLFNKSVLVIILFYSSSCFTANGDMISVQITGD